MAQTKKDEMIFNAKAKANVFKETIGVISPLVNEAKFKLTSKGISIQAVDPAHVAMAYLEIKDKAFEEYKASEMELGIDLDKLNSILRLASSDDIISLEYDEKTNQLKISIGNLVRKMGLIDTAGMPDSKIPALELPAKMIIKVSELKKGIQASEQVSDHLALTIDKERFELTAEGDTDTVNLKLPKDLLIELKVSGSGKFRSLFSIDYLSNMIKTVKEDGEITIFLGSDNPARIEYSIADKKGHVTYLLAPRIESE